MLQRSLEIKCYDRNARNVSTLGADDKCYSCGVATCITCSFDVIVFNIFL